MKAIKHIFAVGLECRSEQIVEIGLVGEVDSGDGRRAGIALLLRDAASSIDRCGDGSFDLSLGVDLPVLEGRVLLHEGSDPLVGMLHNVRVYTVLEILLHVCVEEKVEAGNIAEGDVLSE